MRFSLFDSSSGGTQLGGSPVRLATGVTNGLFTVSIDFGANFPGADRWLQVEVRTNGGGAFTALAPRQQLTATPYAITAGNVTGPINGGSIIGGTITSGQLANGAVTASNIASNSITSGQLASGAAAGNLNASGQSGVASGGVVLSVTDNNSALVNAGYVRIGALTAADAWQQRADAIPLGARAGHTAVWTGSEMIIWGGFGGGSTYYNDGGRYNPAANSWTAVTTIGAPSARDSHTAVWTGSEMIVWGGYSGSYFNDGGRYNPAGNSWTAVTTSGAPVARYQHTAVWTGKEMIVWGGYSGSNFNDTWSYTPGKVLYLYQRP